MAEGPAAGRPGVQRSRRAAGVLEGEVLGALWAADRPLTPAQLQAALGTGLAYNTVHTILTRLQDKGLVRRVRHGGRSGYQPVKDAAQDAADRMRTVLEGGRDRAKILQRFVTSLSPADERALRAALHKDTPMPEDTAMPEDAAMPEDTAPPEDAAREEEDET